MKTNVLTLCPVEGSWVGARARAVYSSTEIGSAYSPPKRKVTIPGTDVSESTQTESSVETVLDIGFREEVCLHSL